MLTSLEVSSLACKCVFYFIDQNIMQRKGGGRGDSMLVNFEDLEMQKWNITMDRAQSVNLNNGIICLVMFSYRVYSQSYGH